MAKIFSPEEIATGRIPEPANFTHAANWLLANLMTSDDPYTNGAIVLGSTTTGAANERSDLDILISHRPEAGLPSEIMGFYRQLFAAAEQKWHTPVESNIYGSDRLLSGRHTIDPMFLGHIRSVDAGRWSIGINPADLVNTDGQDLIAVYREYTLRKEKSFAKYTADNPEGVDYKTLQRAYEIPSAIGRKSLGLLVHAGIVEDNRFHTAPKVTVTQAIADMAPRDVREPLQRLTNADSAYKTMLSKTMAGDMPAAAYDKWLQQSHLDTAGAALDYTVALGAFTEARLPMVSAKPGVG